MNERTLKALEYDKILAKVAHFATSKTPNFNFDDIAQSLDRAKILSILSMGELLKIGHVLQVARNLQTQLTKVDDESIALLRQIALEIYTNKRLEDDIDKSILSETEMSDDASVALKTIRAKLRKISENIKIKLNNFVNSPSYSKYIQDNIVTIGM